MKLSSILLHAISTTAIAIQARDALLIREVLSNLAGDTASLDNAFSNFDGSDSVSIIRSSDRMISDINQGSIRVKNSYEISTSDALELISVIQQLYAPSRALGDTVAAKVSVMSQARVCSVAAAKFDDIATNSDTLVKEIVGKTPYEANTLIASKLNVWLGFLVRIQNIMRRCVDAETFIQI